MSNAVSDVNGHAGATDLARTSNPVFTEDQQNDPLTGLPTQNLLKLALQERLKQSTRRRQQTTLALLQLANFYEIRTWVGPAEADLLLSEIACILEQTLPAAVTLYRCDHYEFALLLEAACSLNARLITDRVKAALQSATSDHIPPQLELKCAVGLANLGDDIRNADILFARARHNLGRSLNANDQHSAAEKTYSLQALQAALRAGALKQLYQPLVKWCDDDLHRYEVRSCIRQRDNRWTGHQLFELAVRNALGETLDRMVINRSLTLLRDKDDPSLHLTVNLSLNSLVSQSFLPWLSGRLDKLGIAPDRLCLQVSEIDVLIAQHHVGAFSRGLFNLGSQLSISHFGCSDDPLGYLSLLRADWIKLDTTLVQDLGSARSRLRLLEELVGQLHQRGFRVIAGMLEDISILPLLWQVGVDAIQGNCLQAPSSTLAFQFPREQALN